MLPSVAANLGPGRCPRPKPNGIEKTLIVCILVCGNVSPQTRYYQKLPNEMAPCDAGKYGGAKAGTYSRLDFNNQPFAGSQVNQLTCSFQSHQLLTS